MERIRIASELFGVWCAAILIAIVLSELVPAISLSVVQILSVIGVFGSLAAIVIEFERTNLSTETTTDSQTTTNGLSVDPDVTPDTNLTYESGEDAKMPEFDSMEKLDTGRVMDVNKVEISGTEEVAVLKIPRLKGTVTAQTYEQFFQDMRTYETLYDAAHVVTLLGWGGVPSPWMLTEYLEGGTLHDRINQIDVQTGIDIILQICDGLHAAHRQGIIHADLTPHNILFPDSEGTSNLKISDFETGSWIVQEEPAGRRISLRYAAPEQIGEAEDPIDEYTDIYRVGVIAYHLFTGVHPIQGDDSVTIISEIQSQSLTPPSQCASKLSKPIDDVILTAMAEEKDDRHDSILHLRDELSKIKTK